MTQSNGREGLDAFDGLDGLDVRGARVVYEPDSRNAEPTTAVDCVDLSVAPGEIVALLGPSGCGKSSLLRAIVGLEPLASGEIRWNGRDLADLPVHKRGFGLMFQDGQLFPHRTVAGNVGYGLRGMPRREREARVQELLEVVGLAEYANRPVTTLSGGEKQRVALARSLAPAPAVLLLDEPLSALDRALREHLAVELRAALVATRTTAVFVTHDHDEAFTVADRVAVMSTGHILQIGTPRDLWRSPASREVAEFLGYEAFLTADDGALLALAPHALRIVDVESGAGPGIGDPGTGSVRDGAGAGDLGLGRCGGGDGAGAGDPGTRNWTGRVLSTVLRKGAAHARVDVAGLGVVSVRVPEQGGAEVNVGDEVRLMLDRARTVPVPPGGSR